MTEVISRLKALQVARKRLSFKRASEIEEVADYAGFSVADAFRCGAEEAQCEILSRLRSVPAYEKKRKHSSARDQHD